MKERLSERLQEARFRNVRQGAVRTDGAVKTTAWGRTTGTLFIKRGFALFEKGGSIGWRGETPAWGQAPGTLFIKRGFALFDKGGSNGWRGENLRAEMSAAESDGRPEGKHESGPLRALRDIDLFVTARAMVHAGGEERR